MLAAPGVVPQPLMPINLLYLMLFRKPATSNPQLPQTEREAIVDLLHFCLYADATISLQEGKFLADVVDVIGWDARSSFGSYEGKSIASARAAKESPDAKKAFLASAAQRLKSKESRSLALDLCKQLLASDGMVDKETDLLRELRAVLS